MEKVSCGQCHKMIKDDEMGLTQKYDGKVVCPSCLDLIYRTIESRNNKINRKFEKEDK